MYVGVCMPVCSCVCLRAACAYVKPNLSAYAIHMVPHITRKGKRKVQGVLQLQTAALPRHQKEEGIGKTKQAQIE